MYGEGISKIGEIIDLGVKAGLVEKSGSWFCYDSIRIAQGRVNAKSDLKENPEVCDRLEAAIRSRTDKVAEEMMTGPDADSED
jgi:recombination protein RecA